MDSTTLPSPGAKLKCISPGLCKQESCLQPPAFSLLAFPVAAAPGSPEVQDAGHGAPALQSLESKCGIWSCPYRAFGEGPDHTNPCHIWKGEKQCLHKYSNGENVAYCCLKKKCLSAVNQPPKNIHEEQNNSPSAKPCQQCSVQGKCLQ